jgi:propionyl-CoA synthetase
MHYAEFHRRSIEDRDAFWAEQAAADRLAHALHARLRLHHPPFRQVVRRRQTNLCHNAVDRHLATRADQNALIFVSTETNQEGSTASASCTPRCSAWPPSCSRWA